MAKFLDAGLIKFDQGTGFVDWLLEIERRWCGAIIMEMLVPSDAFNPSRIVPFYLSSVSVETMAECAWWKVFGCSSEVNRPNYWIAIVLLSAVAMSVRALVRRERCRPAGWAGRT